ncbi:hypothetical protein Ocin01_17071 [Orchesella cincta]|uniref:Uncharacterized protein n=1 Tax=Orchesella cincta TaxID=48709 RepID=A0A1D2M9J8_ORCCI|nr:hypothetical protein Ocin01_17071 [Orchesella cincta]
MRYSIFIVFLACFAANSQASSKSNPRKITDLKSLSPFEKLGLLAISSALPEKNLNISRNSLFAEEEHELIDLYYHDLRTLLTQFVKIKEDAPFPEITDYSWFELCLPFCASWGITLETNRTSITGQERTTSVNEITPTSFKNTFHVPSFVWTSPDFLFEVNDETALTRWIWRNMRVALNNLKWTTTFDYDVDPDLGLQISNLDIKFSIYWLRINIYIVGTINSGGWFIPVPPIFTDWTTNLRAYWANYKPQYLSLLTHRINCVLSNSRSDPVGCINGTATLSEKYHKMNVVQLFETFGLGELDRT